MKTDILLLVILSVIAFFIGYNHTFGGDEPQYINYVGFLRGENAISSLDIPFLNRILVPAIASIIPTDAKTSIQVINLMFLSMAAMVLYTLLTCTCPKYRLFGCVLFIASPPYILYGTAALTDAAQMFFIMLILYLIWKDSYLTPVIIGIGVLAREQIIFMVIPFIIWSLYKKNYLKIALSLFPVCLLGMVFLLKSKIYNVAMFGYGYTPNISHILDSFNMIYINKEHHNLWLILLLSAIIPMIAAYALYALRHNRNMPIVFCRISIISMLPMVIYPNLISIPDGRFLWILYPLCILTICLWIDIYKFTNDHFSF